MDYYSILNSELSAVPTHAIVHILHKPAGRNPEHAFLIVEIFCADRSIIYRRYDLFTQGIVQGRLAYLRRDQGIVKIKELSLPFAMPEIERREQFYRELLNNEEARGIGFQIEAVHAEWLHTEVQKDELNPPNYLLSGDRAFFPALSSQFGHNCYTWARQKLVSLAEHSPAPKLQAILADPRLRHTFNDFTGAIPTKHLYAPEKAKQGCVIF